MSVEPLQVGPYEMHDEIAAGGMARVHLGWKRGAAGFSRTVAIKRLHPEYARDREFVAMLIDEARTAGVIHHPNVVQVLDVEQVEGELFLVMECIVGVALSALLDAARARGEPVEAELASAVMIDVLSGLHAAHVASNAAGPLGIVHRDVSPHNVLVGADGLSRVVDFGVAKAVSRAQSTTREGAVKGKPAYLAPEQISGLAVDARADIFSAGAVLWELLAGRRAFERDSVQSTIAAIVQGGAAPLESVRPGLPAALYAVVARALEADPERRFPSAEAFAQALEAAVARAPNAKVQAWVRRLGESHLARLSALMSSASAARPEGPTPRPAVTAPTAVLPLTAEVAPRRSRAPLLAVAALALAGALGGAAWLARRPAPSPAPPPVVVVEPKAQPEVKPAPQPEPQPEPQPAPQPAPQPEPQPAPQPEAKPARAAKVKAKARPAATAAGPAGEDCDPPYTVGADGVKRFKRGCVR